MFKIPPSIKLLFRKSNGPTLWQYVRETLGQAVRETGQALDRTGQKLETLAMLPDKYVGQDPPCIYQDHLSRHRQRMPLLHCGKPVVSPDAAFIAPCATLIGNVQVQAGASIWYGAILRGDTCLNASSFNKTDQELLEQLEQMNNKNNNEDSSSDTTMRFVGDATTNQTQAPPTETTKTNDEENDTTTNTTTTNTTTTTTTSNPVDLVSNHHEERFDGYQNGGGIYIGVDTNIQDGVIVTARKGATILGQGVTVGHLAQIHSATVDDFALIGMGSILGEGVHVETEALIAAGAVVPAGTRVKAGELWVGQPARKIRDLTFEQRAKLHYQSSEYIKVALTQQRVQELGGNLPPDRTLLDAIQFNLEQEKLYGETMEERIQRNNRWNRTVYREYVMPPPKEEDAASIAGGGEEPLLDSGVAMTKVGMAKEEITKQLLCAVDHDETQTTTTTATTKGGEEDQDKTISGRNEPEEQHSQQNIPDAAAPAAPTKSESR